jgi:hypothetical protein
MMYLMNWRVWFVAGLFVAIAGAWFMGDRHGKYVVNAQWTAEKLAQTEKLRLDERAKTIANEGVDRALQAEKSKRAAADLATGNRLRDLESALAAANSSAPTGTDDPRPTIASECAGRLAALDSYAGKLAVQVTALQGYAQRVCVSP